MFIKNIYIKGKPSFTGNKFCKIMTKLDLESIMSSLRMDFEKEGISLKLIEIKRMGNGFNLIE